MYLELDECQIFQKEVLIAPSLPNCGVKFAYVKKEILEMTTSFINPKPRILSHILSSFRLLVQMQKSFLKQRLLIKKFER